MLDPNVGPPVWGLAGVFDDPQGEVFWPNWLADPKAGAELAEPNAEPVDGEKAEGAAVVEREPAGVGAEESNTARPG